MTFNADQPISSIKQDAFGRAGFAQQIASLCGRRTSESTIIGLHGKWGEGKTSLLNMIGEVLEKEILQIRFNPWCFKGDDDLLHAFFKLMADSLGRKIPSKKAKARNLIADYGESLGILDVIPKVSIIVLILQKIARLVKRSRDLSIYETKDRVKDFIIESRLSIVIFLDDIDRLDNREMAAVFRLVKVLADFPRTAYLMSFDPDIVAKMLAPQYGGSIPDSGYQFLEKVIQVPLTIPKAHEDAILFYIENIVIQVAQENTMNLSESKSELAEVFADGLLQLLDTPRKSIRFTNALRVTLSMLKGEVNFLDLLIIECFKASVPQYYAFVRNNKELLLEDYASESPDAEDDRESIKEKMNKLISGYAQETREAIRRLTVRLFPRFAWVNPAEAPAKRSEDYLVRKHICSPGYFDRYFTYTLQKGEFPDTHFAQYYLSEKDLSMSDLYAQLVSDFEQYSADKVCFKLAVHRTVIPANISIPLLYAISKISDKIQDASVFHIAHSFRWLLMTAESIIKSLPVLSQLNAAINAVDKSINISFANQLTARLVLPKSKEDSETFFYGKEANQIKKVYVERVAVLMKEKGFFNAIREEEMLRALIWWNEIDKTGFQTLISAMIESVPEAPLKFIRIFTPTITSIKSESKEEYSFKSNFTEDEYDRLDQLIDCSRIYYGLLLKYGDKSHLPVVESSSLNDELDDEALIGKFQNFYRLKHGIDGGSGLLRRDE